MIIEKILVNGAGIESYIINLEYRCTGNLHPKERGIITHIDRFKAYLSEELSRFSGPLPPIQIDERIGERELLQRYADEVLAEHGGQLQ